MIAHVTIVLALAVPRALLVSGCGSDGAAGLDAAAGTPQPLT